MVAVVGFPPLKVHCQDVALELASVMVIHSFLQMEVSLTIKLATGLVQLLMIMLTALVSGQAPFVIYVILNAPTPLEAMLISPVEALIVAPSPGATLKEKVPPAKPVTLEVIVGVFPGQLAVAVNVGSSVGVTTTVTGCRKVVGPGQSPT